MEERGLGQIADILVFAILISTAVLMLPRANPIDPAAESLRYATSFAESTLLFIQNSTADQFGGFEYRLSTFGFELDLSFIGNSAKRALPHKTLAQLLAEDALLNLRVEAGGTDLTFIRLNERMDDELKTFLRYALDRIIGGRFGYRLHASTEPIDLGLARVHFETVVEDVARTRDQLCSETVMLSLPISQEELTQYIGKILGIDLLGLELEVDPIVEVTLELWSR